MCRHNKMPKTCVVGWRKIENIHGVEHMKVAIFFLCSSGLRGGLGGNAGRKPDSGVRRTLSVG